MSSRSWQSFDGKIRMLKQHLQLSDLALTLANKRAIKLAGSGKKIAEALGGDMNTYRQLNIPNESTDISRTFITSRKKLHEQAIIELYSVFSSYFASIIVEIEHKQPKRFLEVMSGNSERSIEYEEIIRIGNFNSLIDEMAKRVFRTLENKRSTKDMLNKIIKIVDINIDPDIKDTALLYLEIRHLIIHNNSKADVKFLSMPKSNIVTVNRSNQKITINFDVSNEAINSIFRLCKSFDDELCSKGLV